MNLSDTEKTYVRKAAPKDSVFAFQTKKAAFRNYVDQVYGWDETEQRRLHEQRFQTQDFRIVNQNGMDVGIMAIVTASDGIKINQLFLLPEHQGRGIGEACMRLIMDEARQAALPVHLRVMKVNPRARTFYERLGFICTGETETHDIMVWRPDA